MPIISDVDYEECEGLEFWTEDGEKEDFEGISQDLRIGDKLYRHKPRSEPIGIDALSGDWERFKNKYLEEVPVIEEDDRAPSVDTGAEKAWFIRPDDTYYTETMEKVQLPENFCLDVSSRSSWARYGIETQNVEDALDEHKGYEGRIPLWIIPRDKPVVLREKDSICQGVPYSKGRGWLMNDKLLEVYDRDGVDASTEGSDFIKVSPKSPSKSYYIELTLDDTVKKFTGEWIDPREDNSDKYEEIDIRNGGVVVEGDDFYLASSKEKVELDDGYAGYLDSESRIRGLMPDIVHANAPWIKPGFEGNIIFEIYSLIPQKTEKAEELHEGKNIGGFLLCALKNPCSNSYDSKYAGQEDVVTSKIHQE
ncbi:MAG: dCTP deaminase domain-containing protein [Candidatus Aenigmatarchaeota archaeon]